MALFILVIGGFLGVTMKTGAIQAGIAQIVARLRGRERLLIPILMIVFAIGGTTFGMAEESLAFYALDHHGDDRRRATTRWSARSILLLGCGIGVLGSTINPFATGIASGFAGTSIDQGLIGRIVILILGTAIGIWFVLRYAARVKADPTQSLVVRTGRRTTRRGSSPTTESARRASCGPPEGRPRAVLPGVRRR